MTQQNNYGGMNNQVRTAEDNTNFIAENIYYQQAAQPIEEPISFNVPFPPNPYFTGRDALLMQLHEALQQRRATALSGLGGIGKTQMAVEYAYHYFGKPYQWVFWVRADTELELSTDFGNLARALALPQQEAQETEKKIEAVKRWFANHKDWLLIFDNADRPELLQKFRPQNPQGCILVTSRAPVLDAVGIAEVKQVLKLSRQESIALLMKRTGQEQGTDAERTAAAQLAAEFDDLPLALEQAGAFIRERQIRIQDYWTSYQQQRFKLLEQHPAGVNYPASVTTTWAINFQAIQETAPAAADVLQWSALLAADAIPYELLVKGAKHLGDRVQTALAEAETDPLQLANLLNPLACYSLIKLEPTAQSYSIHRMVQAVVRQGMTDDQLQQWVNRAVAALNAAFPFVDYDQWTQCARLLPHVESIQPYLPDELEQVEALARLLNQAGYYLKQRGQYAEAEPLYQRSLEIREAQLGKDHPDVAESLSNLAVLYKNQGRYSEAEPLLQRSLEICEAQLGKDHPAVAASLNGLAVLYNYQGRYVEAEPLLQRSLEICEAQLGKDHPDVAASLNNLAVLYKNQGRYSEAEPLYERAIFILEQRLGVNHPNTVKCRGNLQQLQQKLSESLRPKPEPSWGWNWLKRWLS
ncbi:tetratricopeptide repeat protein [Leptolyngbya sp. FACHB-711]|uniref:tetratricopeptide repeat protein n=1 Tax=unclassified Leptolyngbya TaxID=2650499 RepID=UPI001683C280|nr:tetratricopeptide repeat protein [Leptolyngbya sp. FACHB-711]MBD1852490.1 tetratricopeptide repeat protein [Cyanobacteria bacterium FACHB-502]MBD2024175.1 tetratricopeptide repeat protein [Leptolyngbya sp. FACHB-711]